MAYNSKQEFSGEIAKSPSEFDGIRIKSEEDRNFHREVLFFNTSDNSEVGGIPSDQINENGDEDHDTDIDMNNYVQIQLQDSTMQVMKYKRDEQGKEMKIWECTICNKEFIQQSILARHLQSHTNERKYACNQCGKAFRQMSTLVQHTTTHSKLRPHRCNICQKTFNRISTLISHQKTHTGKKPHCCHLCNKAFHQKGNLRNHIFTHTNERPYKCDVCQKGFNQMSNLMCHKMKAHQRADKLKHACGTCGKVFQKRITLRNHEQYEHGQMRPTTLSTRKVDQPTPIQQQTGAAKDNAPSVKFTNGVMVPSITTTAMKQAKVMGITPFALLRPLDGIPVLVRVFPSGKSQLLVPATTEDLKKHTTTIYKKPEDKDASVQKESKTYLRIPIVATVIQTIINGEIRMDILEAGPEGRPQVEHNYSYEYENHMDKIATFSGLDDFDDSQDLTQFRDPNMYEAAASLIDLRTRPHYPNELDDNKVEFDSPDEDDIDITNSVIDLEKDHEAFGIIADSGYNTAGRNESRD